jgi:2-isopropylmalate synthase
MWGAFETEYLPPEPRYRLRSHEIHTESTDAAGRTRVTGQLEVDGTPITITGEGDGPVEAFVSAIVTEFGEEFDVVDYAEHAIGRGANAQAVAYVETVSGDNEIRWGIGQDPNITTASLRAVLNAFERQHG